MRRIAIRLTLLLVLLLIASQFVIPPLLQHRVAGRLTSHGGTAKVELSAFPALRLLFGSGDKLTVTARGLSVSPDPSQQEAFKQLDDFSKVNIDVTGSHAGPFAVSAFRVRRVADHSYAVALAGSGAAGDIARFAGGSLAGSFGASIAGLAASALGTGNARIPFDARMEVVTGSGTPQARNVEGSVAGLPAGPLAQVVANSLLSGI
jgi:hypothetical protein